MTQGHNWSDIRVLLLRHGSNFTFLSMVSLAFFFAFFTFYTHLFYLSSFHFFSIFRFLCILLLLFLFFICFTSLRESVSVRWKVTCTCDSTIILIIKWPFPFLSFSLHPKLVISATVSEFFFLLTRDVTNYTALTQIHEKVAKFT